MMQKVNVLGVEYSINEVTPIEYPKIENSDGLCDFTTKTICIDKELNNETPTSMENMKAYKATVVRHELIHAFFYESGLDVSCSWGRNEQLVDWIAIQLPKMVKAMKEVGAL
ncbi:MAG: hypothetical protein ACLTBU_02105 [Zhenhengia sp.]|uniref:hypothetical protein n=1 Tax=Zhenhengia sp. TaxID=2944208 RepID=UPI003994BCE3